MLLKAIEAFYDKPHITDLFQPFDYENGAYLLMDGGIGQMWEIEGVNVDGAGEASLQKASTTFANFLKALPQDTPIQILAVVWRGLEEGALQNFTSGDTDNEFVRDYARRKVAWQEQGKINSFARDEGGQFYPRTIKTYLTIKQRSLAGRWGMHNTESMQEMRKRLKKTEIVVDTSLASGAIRNHRVPPEELIGFEYRVLNPRRFLEVPPPVYNGGDLRRYFAFNSPQADRTGWTFEDEQYSIISFGNNPARPSEEDDQLYTFPNILFREINGVSLFDLAPMMLFAMNFYFPSQDSINNSLTWKKGLSFLHRFNLLGDVSIDKHIANEETRKLLTQMYGGEKVAKMSYHLCIPTPPEEAEFSAAQIVSYLNISTGCNAFKEDLIAPGIFMRCLPFGFDQYVPDEEKFVKRAMTATASIIADVAPLYRSGRGIRTPYAIGSNNRHGEDTWFDPFDKGTSATSPHCIITGASGSGKSAKGNDMIPGFLRNKTNVIVIDKGDSYRKTCQLAGGQYLKFEGEPQFILDPFYGEFDDDHKAFLTSVLAAMATGGSHPISREETAILAEAVVNLSTNSGKSMDDLTAALRRFNDPLANAVLRKLFQFQGGGQYARFIEGDKPRLHLTNPLTVFELGDLDSYPDLQAVVVFLLIHYITQHVKNTEGRTVLYIEEAWSMFKNDVAVDFLIKAVKTFRKYGCCVIFVTQQIDDFSVIARAMNMRDNCPNKILLYQEPDVIMRAAEILQLTEGTVELYKTIKKGSKYAEALVLTQNWTAVDRLSLDPESFWGITSTEPDNVYLNDLMKQGMSLREAIKFAAEKYPYGYHAPAVRGIS